MALAQHAGLREGIPNYTSGAGLLGNSSGGSQQVVGGKRTGSPTWRPPSVPTVDNPAARQGVSAGNSLLGYLQQYSSLDLSKVVDTSPGGRSQNKSYGIPVQVNTGRGFATQYKDVTAYVGQLQGYARSLATRDLQGRALHGSEGLVESSPDSRLFNQNVHPDSLINNPWSDSGANTALQSKSAQFALDNPDYFQVGEDPNNRGNYDRGKLDTNNIAGATDEWVNSMVKWDPKYGYIAPDYLFKRSRPDFLNKYGPYLVLAIAGGAIAAGAMAGGGAAAASGAGAGAGAGGTGTAAGAAAGSSAAAGGTFSGIGAGSTTGSLGLTSAGVTSGALGTTAAGGIGGGALGTGISTGGAAAAGFGIPAAGYAGAGVTAAGGYVTPGGATAASAPAAAGGAPSSGASQGLFSQPAAPVSTGVPSSTGAGTGAGPAGGGIGWQDALGSVGSALGGGGGSGGWLQTLLGAGLSYYQARQMADALEVQDKSTDFSRTSGGHTSFDPSIRALQDKSLAETDKAISGTMGYGTTFRARSDENKDQYDKLYAELTSNQNPYIQARVNPLKEQIASSRGLIQRNQGLRGISGSSFGNDELTNFDFGASRQLGDAGSTATREALGARSTTLGSLGALNQNRLSGETQLTNTINTLNSNRHGIANDRLRMETAGLGLSAQSEAAGRLSEQQKQEMYSRLLAGLLN